MSVADLLLPNDYDLYAHSLVCPEFVKTNSINTTDPQRLLIGDNEFTFDGLDFGTTGSVATYTFNGIPFSPSGSTPVTLAPVGGVANANGASLTGQVLNLQPASSSFPGVVSTTGQTFSGSKTFTDNIIANGIASGANVTAQTLVLPATTDLTHGTIQQPAGTRLLHTTGTNGCVFLGLNAGNLTGNPNGSIGIGTLALTSTTSGSSNVAIGYTTGRYVDIGSSNTLLGAAAGGVLTSGNNNVFIGQIAASGATTMNNSIVIGRSAGPSLTTESNLIEICPDASLPNGGSNSIQIGSTSSTYCAIWGIGGVTPAAPTGMVIIDETTQQLGSADYSNATTNYTVTLDSGTITSSTVRGVSSAVLPITCSRMGNTVTMVIPSFTLVTQSGAASTINLTGVGSLAEAYRPTYNMSFVASTVDNASVVLGTIYVTAGGLVTWQVGPAFTVPTGSSYDLSFSWVIAP